MRTDPFAPNDAELDGNASQTLTKEVPNGTTRSTFITKRNVVAGLALPLGPVAATQSPS
jgi:hypothetical protein